MQLEINEKGSRDFYTESVNVMAQFRRLQKKPNAKLLNYFKIYRTYIIVCAVMLLIIGAMWLAWGSDGFMPVAAALLAVALLFSAVFLVSLNKTRKALLSSAGGSVLTLENDYVQLEKTGSSKVQLNWENVQFVRVYKEALCIHAKDGAGLIICVDRKYEGQILSWLSENKPELQVIR